MEHATPVRRVLVLANPNSRRGQEVGPAIARLRAAGLDLVEAVPERATDISEAIRAHRDKVDAVVLAGGDGTANAAARGLIETGLPLCLLPLGTANDLARTLGLPQKLEEVADLVLTGRPRRLDLGEVNGHPFFNVATIGLAVDLARKLSPEVKRRWGKLSYSIAAIRALAVARPFRAVISGGGAAVRVRTLQIAVGNGRYYGGGVAVEETARIDDGRLDLYSLEFSRVWKLALMLPAFKKGAHGAWDEVRTIRGTSFQIRTRKPKAINTDGEIVTYTPAQFVVRPKAVSVFVPARKAA